MKRAEMNREQIQERLSKIRNESKPETATTTEMNREQIQERLVRIRSESKDCNNENFEIMPLRPGEQVFVKNAFNNPLLCHHGIFVGRLRLAEGDPTTLIYNPRAEEAVVDTGGNLQTCAIRLVSVSEFRTPSTEGGFDSAFGARGRNGEIRDLYARLCSSRCRTREETVHFALSQVSLPFPYDFVQHNCESFAWLCIHSRKRTFQVEEMTRFAKRALYVTRMGANMRRAYKVRSAIRGGVGLAQGFKAVGGLGNVGGMLGAAVADRVLDDGMPATQIASTLGGAVGAMAGSMASGAVVMCAAEGAAGAAGTSGLSVLGAYAGGGAGAGAVMAGGIGAAFAIGGAMAAVKIKRRLSGNRSGSNSEDKGGRDSKAEGGSETVQWTDALCEEIAETWGVSELYNLEEDFPHIVCVGKCTTTLHRTAFCFRQSAP